MYSTSMRICKTWAISSALKTVLEETGQYWYLIHLFPQNLLLWNQYMLYVKHTSKALSWFVKYTVYEYGIQSIV